MTNLMQPKAFKQICSHHKFLLGILRMEYSTFHANDGNKSKELHCSSSDSNKMEPTSELETKECHKDGTLENEELVEPTNCCMSGCANCVWIEYAEELSKRMLNSSEDIQKIIMDKVQDPNMRAFLTMEMRCRKFDE